MSFEPYKKAVHHFKRPPLPHLTQKMINIMLSVIFQDHMKLEIFNKVQKIQMNIFRENNSMQNIILYASKELRLFKISTVFFYYILALELLRFDYKIRKKNLPLNSIDLLKKQNIVFFLVDKLRFLLMHLLDWLLKMFIWILY